MQPIPISPVESCGGEHAAQALSVEDARARLIAEVTPVSGAETVALRSALGRVLAEDVHSPIDVPAHTNSAMDGYALRADDLPANGTVSLRVIGSALAGAPFHDTVNAGECLRIMTGAPLPAGADTVVMQEQVQRKGEHALIGAGHRRGENVRAAGEDLAKGQLALAAGRCVQPADLGLLASLGRAEVRVTRRLRVAFFSTGDELRGVGEPLAEGQIYDSNRYTLYGMLARLGVEIVDMGVVRDDPAALRRAFTEAADAADAIITSGGVSVGEADYVKQTLDALGEIRFWRIAMKPGAPLAFGRVRDAAFFGLPGNPVSVMVTFYQFVEPALRRMMGQRDPRPAAASFKVRCVSRLHKRAGRTEFQRGILESDAAGELVVRAAGQQGSGILRSMNLANCFVILPQDSQTVEPGALVDVQPFYGIL
jgi:molybdopterin molybdotransferase